MFGRRKTAPAQPDPAPAAPADDDTPKVGVFLGSLRSEFDAPENASEPFQRVGVLTESVLNAYRRQGLSAEQAAERLQALRLRDDDGVEWTLGPTTLRWYRKLPGGAWRIAVPPIAADATLTETAAAAVDKLSQMAAPKPVYRPTFTPPARPTTPPVTAPAGEEDSYDPFARSFDLTDDTAASPDAITGTVAGETDDYLPERSAPAHRPVLRAAVEPEVEADNVGYGYGDDDSAADYGYGQPDAAVPGAWPVEQQAAPDVAADAAPDREPLETVAPYPATHPSLVKAEGASETDPAAAGDELEETADLDAGEGADEAAAQAEELRQMLAALSHDTGITLSGFDDSTGS